MANNERISEVIEVASAKPYVGTAYVEICPPNRLPKADRNLSAAGRYYYKHLPIEGAAEDNTAQALGNLDQIQAEIRNGNNDQTQKGGV